MARSSFCHAYRRGRRWLNPLQPPAIAAGVEHRTVRTHKERRGAPNFQKIEHRFFTQEPVEMVDGRNVDVVDYEKTACLDVRVKAEILEIRKRVGVGAIRKYGLQLRGECVNRQGLLSRAFDQSHGLGIWQRIRPDGAHAAVGAYRKYGVIRTEVRKEQRARPGAGLGRMPGGDLQASGQGHERLGRQPARGVKGAGRSHNLF